ncbi:MAG: GGDEF domain-containing protein [Sphingomonadaceae bacterium]|nr:GGDEF domain-containing protein [Sphingomonadaceae bacterium]
MYAVFAGVFIAIARAEGAQGCARKGAAAFAIAVLAIILDTQRTLFPSWFFALAVPLHWLVLIFTADAFLARHGERIPRKPAALLFAVGLVINFWATFIVDRVDIRVPNASTICILLLTLALPKFYHPKMRMLEKLTATAITATWLSYIVRFAIYFIWGQSHEYAVGSLWSQYMMMFYFTSAIITLTLAILLILTITADIVDRHHMATTVDALTGISNRRGYDLMVERQGTEMPPIGAVMMVDLDRFKNINDDHGHAIGDAVLVATALALEKGCSGFAQVARLGGEEFAILVHRTHRDAAGHLAQLLKSAIAAMRLDAPLDHIGFTASIGVARLAKGESVGDAMRRADMALYKAKNEGRNRVELSPDAPDEDAVRAAA